MRTAFDGAWRGAGFGLAMAVLLTWLGAAQVMAFNMRPPVTMLVTGAGMAVVLGALLGLLVAFLLRQGSTSHLLAVALAWAAIEVAVAPQSVQFQLVGAGSPAVACGLVLLGRRVPRAAVVTAVLLVVAGVVLPEVWAGRGADPAPAVTRGTPPPNAPDVVVVVLDTVRADHVSAYGYERPTTPNFDALAADGLLFLEAISPATWSLPSHASLFTGRFASAHAAHDEHRYLDPGSSTLAETLAAAGWDTRSFTANAWISDGLGMIRGFAWTDEAWRNGDVARSMHSMHRVLERFGIGPLDKGGAGVAATFDAWFMARPADAPPAFVFLNFIEAHFPYHQLPASYLGRFTTTPLSTLRRLSLQLVAAEFGGPAPDVETARVDATAMYDAGILYADALLGQVVEAIRRRGTLDRTIIVVLADHGELLGEHGEFGHGHSVYEPVLHVPLLVRYPPVVRTGRASQPVSSAGVYATICDLLGIAVPPSVQAGSLLPSNRGRPAPGPGLAEQYASMLGSASDASGDPLLRHDRRFRAYRSGTEKLVVDSAGGQWLFDLQVDPGETRDVAAARPDRVTRLRSDLEAWVQALGLPALDAAVTAAAPPMDPAARERLRALGYVE
ncbi:MAG TPA: sulfatase [Candidatus Binatia bacterium]|nr:sulfatase [Candidatus Binatia bacterium]